MKRIEISPINESFFSNGQNSPEFQIEKDLKNKIKKTSSSSEVKIDDERVKIYCRIRPFDGINKTFFKYTENTKEGVNQYLTINRFSIRDKTLQSLGGKFKYDYIFDEEFTQIEVFQETCVNLISDLVEEKKSSIVIANGLNNSGKTYSIVGDIQNPGLLPLSLRFVFDQVKEKNNPKIKMYCNYFEIDAENLYDLLNEKDGKCNIVKIPGYTKFPIFPDLNYFKLDTIQDCSNALNIGNKVKKMNRGNSLTHTCFKIILRFFKDEDKFEEASLMLMDLAHKKDTPFVNLDQLNCEDENHKNLPRDLYWQHLALGRIIKGLNLMKLQKFKKTKPKTNYCDLTSLLRYYITGNEKIILISNVNPDSEQADENLKVFYFSAMFKEGIHTLDKYSDKSKIEKTMNYSLKQERDRDIEREKDRLRKLKQKTKLKSEEDEKEKREHRAETNPENKLKRSMSSSLFEQKGKISLNNDSINDAKKEEKSLSPKRNFNKINLKDNQTKKDKENSPLKEITFLSKEEKDNLFNTLKKNVPVLDTKHMKNNTGNLLKDSSLSILSEFQLSNYKKEENLSAIQEKKISQAEIERMKKDYENLRKKFEEQEKIIKAIVDKNQAMSFAVDRVRKEKENSLEPREILNEVHRIFENPVYNDSLQILNSKLEESLENKNSFLNKDSRLYNIILLNPSIENFTILNRDSENGNLATKDFDNQKEKDKREVKEVAEKKTDSKKIFADNEDFHTENKNILSINEESLFPNREKIFDKVNSLKTKKSPVVNPPKSDKKNRHRRSRGKQIRIR